MSILGSHSEMLVANHNFGRERMGIPQLIRGLNAGRNAEDRLKCSKTPAGKWWFQIDFLFSTSTWGNDLPI